MCIVCTLLSLFLPSLSLTLSPLLCSFIVLSPSSPPSFPPCPPPGQLAGLEDTDGGVVEDVPTSLEVGLLGHVRKVLMLLPDSLASRVVGHAIQHTCLIAMAYNRDIVIRTAVVRVSQPKSALHTPHMGRYCWCPSCYYVSCVSMHWCGY